jgi:GAF domain-containing protein
LSGVAWYFKTLAVEEEDWTVRIEDRDRRNRILTDKLDILRMAEADTRARETAIVGLYEITRDMSAQLKFSDIFKVFSAFLKNNLSFKRCELLVLEKEGSGPNHLGKVYGVWREDPMLGSEREVDYEKMIRYFLSHPERLNIGDVRGTIDLEEVGLSDPSTTSFFGMPLLVEGKPVAILTIENLSGYELERFSILAIQLSLEIKKVFLYEAVEKMAITDSLTGLYVRRYFSERLEEEIGRSARQRLKFSFLMLDIDDFKKTNDTYGHLVGDVVLKEIGAIIKDNIREIDLACRYGGGGIRRDTAGDRGGRRLRRGREDTQARGGARIQGL